MTDIYRYFFVAATPWQFLSEDMFSIFAGYTLNMQEGPCMFLSAYWLKLRHSGHPHRLAAEPW